MKRLLTFALILLAAPAWSLSCLRPDVVRTLEEARNADAGFWIVRGRVLADQPIAVPQPGVDGRFKDDASAQTPVLIEGQGLHGDGSFSAFAADITLSITCLAHWCGSVTLDEEHFMAIELTDSGPELIADPCSSRIVRFSEDGEDRLRRCVRDGVCEQSFR